MYKFTLFKSFLCVAALSASLVQAQQPWHSSNAGRGQSAVLSVQDDVSRMNLGYVDDDAYIYESDGIGGFDEDVRAGAAILLPEDMLSSYVGAKIVQFQIGYSCGSVSATADLFIRKEFSGENLASGSGELQLGWNSVDLDTPLEITEDMGDIYCGYYLTIPKGTYAIPIQRYAIVPNSCFLWKDDEMNGDEEIWTDRALELSGMVLLKVTIETSGDMLNNKLALNNVRHHDVQIKGEEDFALFSVTNKGANDIETVELTFVLGEDTQVNTFELANPISSNQSDELAIPFTANSSGKATVSLTKVNGKENQLKSDFEMNIWAVDADVAGQYEYKPLLEFFESEAVSLIPHYYNEIFLPGFDAYKDDIIMLGRHCDDQFMTRDNEDLNLLLDLVDNDSMNVYIPNISISRTDMLNDPVGRGLGPVLDLIFPEYVAPVYEEALARPTFVAIDMQAKYNLADMTAEIRVEGDIADGVILDDEPLFVSLFVVEDGVESMSQLGNDDPDTKLPSEDPYIHNNVIRLQPTPMYGEQLESNSGAFSKTFDIEVEPDWNTENMRIVACVNRGEENGHYDKEIINAAEIPFPEGKFIEESKADGLLVYALDGSIVVDGEYSSLSVYDMTGRLVENSGLRGCYIARVVVANGAVVFKVMVE